jgi:hypothetical protein
MKGNPAVPGGSLTSKPTWGNTSRCSPTSAFFSHSVTRDGHDHEGRTDGRVPFNRCRRLKASSDAISSPTSPRIVRPYSRVSGRRGKVQRIEDLFAGAHDPVVDALQLSDAEVPVGRLAGNSQLRGRCARQYPRGPSGASQNNSSMACSFDRCNGVPDGAEEPQRQDCDPHAVGPAPGPSFFAFCFGQFLFEHCTILLVNRERQRLILLQQRRQETILGVSLMGRFLRQLLPNGSEPPCLLPTRLLASETVPLTPELPLPQVTASRLPSQYGLGTR